MNTQHTIETTGSITKMEMLSTVEENIQPGTLVLTNSNPFPGFKDHAGSFYSQKRPQSYYLIMMYRYFPEKLERIDRALKEENLVECCSSFGEIIIQDKILPCIRLKSIKSESVISFIQDFFRRHEIKFMPYKKVLAEGKIKVFKHFKLIEMAEGIYRDLFEGEKFYFSIPFQLNWKLFEHFVKRVKAKMQNNNFDPALGTINRFSGTEDVIRVYDTNKTMDRALEIKKNFMREFKKDKLLLVNYLDSSLV